MKKLVKSIQSRKKTTNLNTGCDRECMHPSEQRKRKVQMCGKSNNN